MNTSLVLHRGAQEVSRAELEAVPTPASTATWFPIAHAEVLETASVTLAAAGFQIARSRLALSRNNGRFFATLDLTASIASGITLAVGIRNSIDRSLPIAFCAGSRVFICDNLAFNSEIVIARKHTRFGHSRFAEAVARAVQGLQQYRENEAVRIRKWQLTDITDDEADALLLRSFEREIVSAPMLPGAIKEWRHPSFEEFEPRTLWSLFNAITAVLGPRQKTNPQEFAAMTLRLHGLFENPQNQEAMA